MITVGKAFKIPELRVQDDTFVPVRFRCRSCKKRVRCTMIDVMMIECAAGRLLCVKCGALEDWRRAATTLGQEYRIRKPLYKTIKLPQKLQK